MAHGVEHVEIVLDGGKVDEAAHAEIRHVDEQPEIAHLDDDRRVPLRASRIQLAAEVGKQFDVPTVAFRIGGIAFRDREMLGHLA